MGQGEDVGKRLRDHQRDDNKEFSNHTVVFVSSSGSLNRAHVLHLEAELVRRAMRAGRTVIANGNQPTPPKLSPVDLAVA